MNMKQLITSQLIAMMCLALVTGISFAQQPFESTQDDPPVRPQDDLLNPMQESNLDRAPFVVPQDTELGQGQAVVLNEKYAGWQEASGKAGAQRIGSMIRSNWIMVDANGRFEGKVIPVEGADVSAMNVFLLHMGRLVKQTTLNPQGRFEFQNVRQGAYALIGWGENGFFAFGFNILGFNEEAQGSMLNTVQVSAYQNKTTINTDWVQYYAPQVTYRVYGRYLTGEGREDSPALYGYEGLVNFLPAATPATSISSQPVKRTADGRLYGRIHQINSLNGRPVDVRTTKVMLFQGDSVVASTTTDNYGVYEFRQVPDGDYGLVAVGVDGAGLIGISVRGSTAAGTPIDFTMISSETMGWLNHYASEVAYRRILLAPRPEIVRNQPFYGGGMMCPMCGNAPGGCGTCQSAYLRSYCRSRGISFEEWQQMGCESQVDKLGSGKLIADVFQGIRKNVERVDSAFERAFYPSEFEGGALNDTTGAPLQPGQIVPGYGTGIYQDGLGPYYDNPYYPGQQPYYGN